MPEQFIESQQGRIREAFPPRAGDFLKSEGFQIFRLPLVRLESLTDRRGWTFKHLGESQEEAIRKIGEMDGNSPPSGWREVAIKPPEFYLPNSNNLSLDGQKELVLEYSRAIRERLGTGGLKAIIGSAREYVQLVMVSDEKAYPEFRGWLLRFGRLVRTTSFTENGLNVAIGGIPYFYISMPSVTPEKNRRIWVAPIIVPT